MEVIGKRVLREENRMKRNKLRVLMIEHFSSSNNYSIDLCRELNKYVNLMLLTVNDSNLVKEEFNFSKKLYGSSKENKIIKIFSYLKSVLYTIREIIKGKYDVVHIQTFRTLPIEPLVYLFLKPFINRFIITIHNIAPHEGKLKHKKILEKLYSEADALIVHNNESKKVLLEAYNIKSNDVFVIPHGIYSNNNINLNNINKTRGKKTNFLFFGLIRKYKGIDILIEAVSSLPDSVKENIAVTIIGKQDKVLDNTDYNKKISDNNLEHVINFKPVRIPDEELSLYFNDADFCIFPYKNIYGSGALLMSYTFNVPVIVSDLPSFLEETNYGKSGLIFKNNDSKDLSRKICEASKLNKNKIELYKKNINILVTNKYNWESSARSTVRCYIEGK